MIYENLHHNESILFKYKIFKVQLNSMLKKMKNKKIKS